MFAAANAMEWLSFGAQSVDWWDVHNYGTPTADFGMFSSGSSGEPAVDTPYPPYYGYALAAKLAVKGAKVGTLLVPTPNIYAYYSQQPGGGYSVMLVNADPSNAYTIATSSLGITSTAETEYTYSAANPAIASGSFSGGSVSVPAQSIVVLSGGTGQPSPTPTPTPTPSQSASPTDRDSHSHPDAHPHAHSHPDAHPDPHPHGGRRLHGQLVGDQLLVRRVPARLHRNEPGDGGNDRLDRRLLMARIPGNLADLERYADPERRGGHDRQPELRRRASARRLDDVRPARHGRRAEHAAGAEMQP